MSSNLVFSIKLALLGMAAAPILSGCGLLIGNVRPVDEKSDQYGVIDLAKEKPPIWDRLDPAQADAEHRDHENTSTEVSDVAFQAKHAPSIIALNSACRPTVETQDKSLQELTHELLLGISDISERNEQNLTVQATPALKTTLEGKMNSKPIKVSCVVLRRKACVYDLLYMSPPEYFTETESDFDHFVASLRLK
ncbi:hypothetical protein WDW37_00120 [Bdellovibrionota bacterium FG-1]